MKTGSSAQPTPSSPGPPRRRSASFWILLLLLDLALIVAVALATGQNQADPKRTVSAVLGLVGLYCAIFYTVKQREIAQGQAADIRGAIRGAEIASTAQVLTDPTQLSDAELYGAMAIEPVDAKALKARARVWDVERRGTNTGMLIVVLALVTVAPIYFFHTFVPSLVGGILIAAIAFYRSIGLLGQGLGGLYELTDEVLKPLKLRVTERFTVSIESTVTRPGGAPVTRGALELQGDRHGRHVKIRTRAARGLRSRRRVEVTTTSAAVLKFQAHHGQLTVVGDAPAPARDDVAQLPRSTRWDGVSGQVEGGLVTVTRSSVKRNDPLLDLWLGERVAGLLEGAPPATRVRRRGSHPRTGALSA